jgi:hypothetical protein
VGLNFRLTIAAATQQVASFAGFENGDVVDSSVISRPATAPLEVFGGDTAAVVAAPPPPPQAATASATSCITAAAAKVMGLLRVMPAPLRLGSVDSRSHEQRSNHATRSPRPKTS